MAVPTTKSIASRADSYEGRLEIIGHLGVALLQVAPDDDPIVIGHIRSAYDHAIKLRRSTAWQPSPSPAGEN